MPRIALRVLFLVVDEVVAVEFDFDGQSSSYSHTTDPTIVADY